MAETATAPATETAPVQTKTEEKPILLTEEPKVPTPEKTLFQPTMTVEEAKAAAIKELADKTAAEAAKAEEAAKKAELEKTKPTETVTKPPEKVATTTPTDYTLDLPENSALTKEDLDSTLKEAKEAGLSAEEAKEMLQSKDQVAKVAQTRLIQKQEQDLKAMVVTWRDQVKNDPELGGERLAQTAIKASRAFKAIASPAMQEFCQKTGFADHPEMVRAMMKVYDLIGEDKFIRGTTGVTASAPATDEEKAKKLFGGPVTKF